MLSQETNKFQNVDIKTQFRYYTKRAFFVKKQAMLVIAKSTP